jgi:hypothetical protein
MDTPAGMQHKSPLETNRKSPRTNELYRRFLSYTKDKIKFKKESWTKKKRIDLTQREKASDMGYFFECSDGKSCSEKFRDLTSNIKLPMGQSTGNNASVSVMKNQTDRTYVRLDLSLTKDVAEDKEKSN